MGLSRALAFTLRYEGGYVNDPKDPGGETRYGISKRAYPKLDIKNLTAEQASDIYRSDYWGPSGAAALPEPLDMVVFDTAVNMGIGKAIRMLQEVVCSSMDGRFGPATAAAVQQAIRRRGMNDVLEDYLKTRWREYDRLVARNSALRRFINGWRNRVEALASTVGVELGNQRTRST